jgi:protein required for attachment to host cells
MSQHGQTTGRQPVVWVLVADGARARVVVPAERQGQFATRIAFDPASARMAPDAAGGAVDLRYEAAAPGHHAEKPSRDPKSLGEQGFAVSVAHHVNAHALRHDFDQLVLVAPAHTLHHLREALAPQAARLVVGSVTKDYAGLNDHAVSPHLAQWWLAPPG